MLTKNPPRDPSIADVAGLIVAAVLAFALFLGACSLVEGVKHLMQPTEQVAP